MRMKAVVMLLHREIRGHDMNVTGNLSLMLHSPYTILRIREPPVLVSKGLLYSTLKKKKKKLSGDLL